MVGEGLEVEEREELPHRRPAAAFLSTCPREAEDDPAEAEGDVPDGQERGCGRRPHYSLVGSRPAAALAVRPCSAYGAVGRGDETRPAQRETAAADRPYFTDRPASVNRYLAAGGGSRGGCCRRRSGRPGGPPRGRVARGAPPPGRAARAGLPRAALAPRRRAR